MLTRRSVVALAPALAAAGKPRYKVGVTNNTRGGWETDFWLATRESHEVGYRNVETFFSYLKDSIDKPGEVLAKAKAIGVGIITVSNSGPMEMAFNDRAKQPKLLDEHTRLARFVRALGGNHLKINLGPRRPTGTTDEDLKVLSDTVEKLGKRTAAEGVRLAIHAHMWSQFENRREVDYVLSHTDPKTVAFVLDTGHITLAGIDPVELTKTLGHRIVEFHLKDTKPDTRGGARARLDWPDMMTDPPFLPLGSGGVDFVSIKNHLDSIGWQGWLTTELDSSPFRPPKESAAISLRYARDKMKVNG
ncbi:MAG: TIM barrel protein [Acidobacteria bacterium]|nr:TIM barrel protein [Acidobacteriota bacterium]